MPDSHIHVIDHPLIAHYLTQMRDCGAPVTWYNTDALGRRLHVCFGLQITPCYMEALACRTSTSG